MKTTSIILVTLLFVVPGTALLRGNEKEATLSQEAGVLDGWNSAVVNERDLQGVEFTSFEECFEGTAGNAIFCSCIFNDMNTPEYCGFCGQALVDSQFSLTDTSNFGKWFTESSVLNLAQTGSYYGIEGIAEYVNFIYSLFFTSYDLMEAPAVKFIPNEQFAQDGACIVSFASKRRVGLSPEFYEDTCYLTSVGSTVYYTTTTLENGYIDISRTDVWYPESYIEAVFTNMDENKAVEWLCSVIGNYCPSIWELNNFDNNDNKCAANYLGMPKAEGELLAIDGKSLGCKLLHGTFVPANDYHCAHISFKKQEDPSGNIKCQKTNNNAPEDIFTQEELDFFAAAGAGKFGFDPELLADISQANC